MSSASRSPASGSLVLLAVVAVLLLGMLGAARAVAGAGGGDAAGDIEPPAAYEPQSTCRPQPQPGTEALRDLVLEAYPETRGGGIVRACDEGGRSEHKDGRAWDWMVDARDEVEAAQAAELIDWLLATDEDGNEHAMARRLGVMYLIWDREIFSLARAEEGWRPYRGEDPHVDHVHISLDHAGAARETTYWTEGHQARDTPGG